MVQRLMSILTFRDELRQFFLDPHRNEELRSGFPNSLQICFQRPGSSGLLGFAIAALSRWNQASLKIERMTKIGAWWRAKHDGTISTMEALADNLLSVDNESNKNSIATLRKADLHVRLTIGQEMAERNKLVEGLEFLGNCVKELRAGRSNDYREYCLATTELVKCCNRESKELEGESWALEALQHEFAPRHKSRIDDCYLKTALADSLMGQGKYEDAEALLRNILAVASIPNYLTVALRLRLSKARRRLGRLDLSFFDSEGPEQETLHWIEHAGTDLKIELSEELSITISLMQLKRPREFGEAKAFIKKAIDTMASDPNVAEDWRYVALQKRIQEPVNILHYPEEIPLGQWSDRKTFENNSLKLATARALILSDTNEFHLGFSPFLQCLKRQGIGKIR